MSKNITIQEGGTGKQMSVSKLKTNMVGGGTCLWVPEDEASLGTKSITSNGTYKASDDGKYGYSQVTVNVPGGQGSANPDGTPSSGGGTPSSDPSSPSPSSPGGPGSGIVGTDPNSGNDYFIGVDSGGNIVTTPLPSSLEIVSNPTNTNYENGDSIDTSGAVVVAKNADGSTWTSPEYPDGIIPLSELELSTNTAEYDENHPITATTDSGLDTGSFSSVPLCGTIAIEFDQTNIIAHHLIVYTGNFVCVYNDINTTAFISAGSDPSSGYSYYHLTTIGNGQSQTEESSFTQNSAAFSYDGKTVYYSIVQHAHKMSPGANVRVTPVTTPAIGEMKDAGMAAWVAVYGSVSGNSSVGIRWNRPGDRKELAAEITITVSGGGFSSDNSGSGTGGGTSF